MRPGDEPAQAEQAPLPLEYRSPQESPEQWERLRRRMRPPGPVATVFAVGLSLMTLWWARMPGGDGGWIILLAGMWLVLGLYWLGSAVEAGFHVARGAARRAGLSPRLREWLPLPLILLTTVTLVEFRVPLRIGLWMSRAPMQRFVQQVHAGTNAPTARVGIYAARRPERIGSGGVRFVTNSRPGIFTMGGFAHLPAGPPPPIAGSGGVATYVHIEGPWYEFHWDD